MRTMPVKEWPHLDHWPSSKRPKKSALTLQEVLPDLTVLVFNNGPVYTNSAILRAKYEVE